jgi:hypothetical protein
LHGGGAGIFCTVLSLRYCNGMAFSGRPAGRPNLRSASAPRRRRVIPARSPPLRTRAPRARPALAAPRPGPRGPGPGSSSRADVAGSGRSWPRLALRHGSRTLTVCDSPRQVTIAPGGVRGPAGRCAAAGVVTWRPRGPAGDRVLTAGSTPAVVTVTWGAEGDAVPPRSSAPLVIRWPSRKWHPVVLPLAAQQVPPNESSVPSPLCQGPARVPTGLRLTDSKNYKLDKVSSTGQFILRISFDYLTYISTVLNTNIACLIIDYF